MLLKPSFFQWFLALTLGVPGLATVVSATGCHDEAKGPPEAPTDLTARRDTNSLVITWSADEDSRRTRFDIYRVTSSDSDSSYKKLAEVPATKRSYIDKEIVSGHTYQYYIVSLTADGVTSEPSDVLERSYP